MNRRRFIISSILGIGVLAFAVAPPIASSIRPPLAHQAIADKMKVRFDLLNDNFKELEPEFIWSGAEDTKFQDPPTNVTVKTVWIWNWVTKQYGIKDNALGMMIHDMPWGHLIEFYNMDGTSGLERHYAILPDGKEVRPLYAIAGFGSIGI